MYLHESALHHQDRIVADLRNQGSTVLLIGVHPSIDIGALAKQLQKQKLTDCDGGAQGSAPAVAESAPAVAGKKKRPRPSAAVMQHAFIVQTYGRILIAGRAGLVNDVQPMATYGLGERCGHVSICDINLNRAFCNLLNFAVAVWLQDPEAPPDAPYVDKKLFDLLQGHCVRFLAGEFNGQPDCAIRNLRKKVGHKCNMVAWQPYRHGDGGKKGSDGSHEEGNGDKGQQGQGRGDHGDGATHMSGSNILFLGPCQGIKLISAHDPIPKDGLMGPFYVIPPDWDTKKLYDYSPESIWCGTNESWPVFPKFRQKPAQVRIDGVIKLCIWTVANCPIRSDTGRKNRNETARIRWQKNNWTFNQHSRAGPW